MMRWSDFPESVRRTMEAVVSDACAPAFLRVDASGVLEALGGDVNRYGIGGLQLGSLVEDSLPLLEGLLPVGEFQHFLPAVETPSGTHADLRIFSADGSEWVLFLDVDEDVEQQQLAQQRAYDEALDARRLARLLDRLVGAEALAAVERLSGAQPERREVSVLALGLRDLTAGDSLSMAFEAFNAYVEPIVGAVLDHGGTIDVLESDTVVAVFGLGSTESAAQRAFAAARAAQDAVRRVALIGLVPTARVAIGVATGAVVMGMMGNSARRGLVLLGDPLTMARAFMQSAEASDILCDATTRKALGNIAAQFDELEVVGPDATHSAHRWYTPLEAPGEGFFTPPGGFGSTG